MPENDNKQVKEGRTPSSENWPELVDLAPKYEPAKHAAYLNAVLTGINSGRVKNVALSGPYGAGKSSILQGLVRRYPSQVAAVSLATVRSTHVEVGEARDKLASTNELQKEILKQILYLSDPASMPASRFSRTSKFRWGRNLMSALFIGLAGVALQLAITTVVATAKLEVSLSWRPDLYVPTFFSVSFVAILLLRIANGRLRISDLSAGPAKLTLTNEGGNYFDDYLDEIIYFFQASKKRILILEDMDRFGNVEVFEDLRALNDILNAASQLKTRETMRKREPAVESKKPAKVVALFNECLAIFRKFSNHAKIESFKPDAVENRIPSANYRGPIVFVYAIRDSLLAETVKPSGDVGHDAFTRSKFFDLIVPVVPFVTEHTARGALKKELESISQSKAGSTVGPLGTPSAELVRTIAKYFPDQRQIRNIRNEFAMYRHLLLQPSQHPVELTADRLLALVLYKNLEVADFEKIRLGESKLNQVSKLAQDLVDENLRRIGQRLEAPTEEMLKKQATEVGKRIHAAAQSLGVTFRQNIPASPERGSGWVNLSAADLQRLDTWQLFLNGATIINGNGNHMSRENLETAFSVSLAFAEKQARTVTEDEQHDLLGQRTDLESATWADLWNLPEFTLTLSESDRIKYKVNDTILSFSQVVKTVFGEGLATDLISSDLLTKNYAIFSTHFDAQFLGLEAQNFLDTIVAGSSRHQLAPLSAEATIEIVKDQGALILERAGMVNIHVLSHLLSDDSPDVRRLIAQLRSWTREDVEFVRNYLQQYGNSTPIDALAKAFGYLASLASGVIRQVLATVSLEENVTRQLFEAALENVSAEDFRTLSRDQGIVRVYAQDHHQDFDFMTHESVGAAVERLIDIHVNIDDLSLLSQPVRERFVRKSLFAMTVANLGTLSDVDKPGWVSLEKLSCHPAAYRSVLGRIDEYLQLMNTYELDPHVLTAESADNLVAILEDVLEFNEDTSLDTLRLIARHSDQSIKAGDITEVNALVQEALLLENRAAITAENLLARFEPDREITAGIAAALSTKPELDVTEFDSIDQLFTATIESSPRFENVLTGDVVAQLLQSQGSNFKPSAESVLKATETVAIRLIQDGDVDTIALRQVATVSSPWPVREAILSVETTPDQVTTAKLVAEDDLFDFMTSTLIEDPVKAHISTFLDKLQTAKESADTADMIAAFFANHVPTLSLEQIHLLIGSGASSANLLTLLCMSSARDAFMSNPSATLNKLGGPYAAICSKKPRDKSPKFPNTLENKQLLEQLKKYRHIKWFKEEDEVISIQRASGLAD